MEKNSSIKLPLRSLGSSFRDPAGFVFKNSSGDILRQINQVGLADFDLFINSGLYDNLVNDRLIVSHEVLVNLTTKHGQRLIKPRQIPYITYPFEWSFSQLQDAALLTLEIQKRALKFGMTLKDSTGYNIQFLDGKPIFIDTLSFEKYESDTAWPAYRQFCQHFLAPLALMSYTDLSLSQLLRVHIDGVPLDVSSKLLPRNAKLRPGIAIHVVLHGRAQKAKATEHKTQTRIVKQSSLEAILESLERCIKKLKPHKATTEWGDYYDKTNYTIASADQKAKHILKLIKPLNINTVLDIGGNNGRFSRVLHDLGVSTVCTDIDPVAVEANYGFTKMHGEEKMLPLLIDLTNPGGALGWANNERETIQQRLQSDVVMALAIIHHLAISNNLPFENVAHYFSGFGKYLLIEFVPKEDSQVQKLLSTRKDIFPQYNEHDFKIAFSEYFSLLKEVKISGTKRTLYMFRRK